MVVKKKDIECSTRQITGPNGVEMIKPSPTANPSSGAAWPIYILSIYIQMKMTCLVMEVGMQTHIMPPHHFGVCTTVAHSNWIPRSVRPMQLSHRDGSMGVRQ